MSDPKSAKIPDWRNEKLMVERARARRAELDRGRSKHRTQAIILIVVSMSILAALFLTVFAWGVRG